MILTFLCSGVLIAAARGNDHLSTRALTILNDPERNFVSTPFVRLEVTPKAAYYKRVNELAFYSAYFTAIHMWVEPVELVISHAQQVAESYGLSGMDALHVAAALQGNVDELITTERPGKPIHRVSGLRIVSLHSLR